MISASIARPRTVAVRASKEAGASAKAVVVPAPKAASVVDRRAALGMIAGVAAVVAAPSESKAAYGEAANVFGKVRKRASSSNWQRERMRRRGGESRAEAARRERERERTAIARAAAFERRPSRLIAFFSFAWFFFFFFFFFFFIFPHLLSFFFSLPQYFLPAPIQLSLL